MPKKKSWFARVTDFLFPVKDDKETQLKNNKKKRRLFGSTRTTKNPPSLVAPSLSRERTEINARPPDEAEVSSNSTAAAAQYPSLSLPSSSTSAMQLEEYVASKILLCRAQLLQHVEDLAAIKIQTAFRGYLARKALRALKGLVRLQAIIRGRAVRRQAVATLKSLQSIVNIQSQVCATRYQKANENKQYDDPRDVKFKIEQSGRRRRDHTLLMDNEQNAIVLSKTEAMMRRNRLKAFPFNHRHSADVEDARVVGRLRQWLEEHDKHEVPMKEEIKRVDIVRLGNAQSAHQAATDQESTLGPRRSYDSRKHRDISNLGEKIDPKPAYMAATESARARVRSMGSARLVRPMQLESYSDGDSPYKSKISPMSSINSERNWGGALVKSGSYRQRSYTGFKGVGGSMRFNRNVTDSGPDNGRLLLNWN